MEAKNNSQTSEILKTLISQLPLVLMLVGGEFSYTKLITICAPIIVMILMNTNFTWKKVNRAIPEIYAKCQFTHDTKIFRELSYFYNNYRYNEIKLGICEKFKSKYNCELKTQIHHPIIVPVDGFYDMILLNDTIINKFIENGIDQNVIGVDIESLKNKYIHIEIISVRVNVTDKKGEPVEKISPQLVIYAENVEIIDAFIAIIYNLDEINTRINKKFSLRKYVLMNGTDDNVTSSDITVIKNYKNVFLSKNNSEFIQETIKEWIISIDENIKMGIPPKIGLLLTGHPGTGKSSIIYAIAEETKKHIYSVNLRSMDDSTIICNLKNLENYVIVFEDIDCIISLRDREKYGEEHEKNYNMQMYSNNTNQSNSTSTSTLKTKDEVSMDVFLEILDGYSYLKNCIVIMTTNHMEMIDPAIIRPGRIDHIINFDLCDTYQFSNIFKYYTNYDYAEIDKNFIFEENKYTSSYIINTLVIPNKKNPKKILKLLSEKMDQNILE